MINPILLHAPDFSRLEEQAVFQALRWAPGSAQSCQLVHDWEQVWTERWQRHAIAFASPRELVQRIKELHGWPHGSLVSLSPLLDPVWREALAAHWLAADFCTRTPQPISRALLVEHPFGLPATPPALPGALCLEVISSMPIPLPGTGWGDLQIACFDGNRLLQASGTALVLTGDPALAHAFRATRQRPPGAVACALGLAQWSRLPDILARRAEHAAHYLELRLGESFHRPSTATRHWERFVLMAATPGIRLEAAAYLNKAKIQAASPIWHLTPQADTLPDVRHFLDHALALPLYETLAPVDRKRIINRLRRWSDRWQKTTQTP